MNLDLNMMVSNQLHENSLQDEPADMFHNCRLSNTLVHCNQVDRKVIRQSILMHFSILISDQLKG